MANFNKIAEVVTAKLIERVEKIGKLPWQKPWDMRGSEAPRSVHGHFYRGINLIMTMGYDDPRFMTFKQAKQFGGKCKKGKGLPIVLWKWYKEKDKQTGKETGKSFPSVRYFTVWNVEDIEDLDMEAVDKKCPRSVDVDNNIKPNKEADRIISEWLDRPEIKTNRQGQAYYNPIGDYVSLPPRKHFKSQAGFYRVKFHELVHSTGHVKRLDRLESCKFGSGPYAKEELVAEIGASMLSGFCGFTEDKDMDQSAAYLKSWLSVLKSDPAMLVSAAQKAQQACDMIMRVNVETAKAA